MKTKLLISLVLIGVLLAGSFLFLYSQKEENVSISDMIFNKLRGITGFVAITHNVAGDWTGTYSQTLLKEVTKVI
jgi:hypothetical protein